MTIGLDHAYCRASRGFVHAKDFCSDVLPEEEKTLGWAFFPQRVDAFLVTGEQAQMALTGALEEF